MTIAPAIAHAELNDNEKAAAAATDTLRAWPLFDPQAFAGQFRHPSDRLRIADGLRKAGLS